ncbi:MAG: hypothetical protein V4590_05665, partial [Bacteroidota bacterium]
AHLNYQFNPSSNFGELTESGDPGCPTERIYINQFYTINFISIKGNFEFSLSQYQSDYAIRIDRSTYPIVFVFESGGIDLEATHEYYIDSQNIKNNVYRRISVFLKDTRTQLMSYDSSYQLLYNKQHGLLYIKSVKQNEEYSLIPKP